MKKLFSTFIFILFANSIAFACSMFQAPPFPFSEPFRGYYILVGEVVGYTDAVKGKFYGEGRGMKIKPLEAINLPKPTSDYYELFKFGVEPSCQPAISDLRLPIGTKLRIIAGEATLLPNRSPENRIRLESQLFDRLSIVTDKDEFTTDADSVFDYNMWKSLQAKVWQSKTEGIRGAFADFLFVEVNKDLLRLEKAKSKAERYEILERLLYAPGIDFPGLINPDLKSYGRFEKLFPMSPSSEKQRLKKLKLTSTEKLLLEKREEIEKAGYYSRI